MKQQRMITIDEDLNDKLRQEVNVSSLINSLLENYYKEVNKNTQIIKEVELNPLISLENIAQELLDSEKDSNFIKLKHKLRLEFEKLFPNGNKVKLDEFYKEKGLFV